MYLNNPSQNRRFNHKKIASPKSLFVIALLIALGLVAGAWLTLKNNLSNTAKNAPPANTISFDKRLHSLTNPASLWIIANKKYPLNPKDYTPSPLRTPDMAIASEDIQVREEAAAALEALNRAAEAENINLKAISAYRSYETQKTIYESEVKGFGQAQADRESARPGYSEHQTGWAVDLGTASGKCQIEACFAQTAEGKWLAANAYKYGFVLRYPENKEQVTGYMYEPWHLRFVGIDLATEMRNQKIQTLEEFFGLPAAPSY